MQKEVKCVIGKDYPEPIVDQTQAASSARAIIKAIHRGQGFKDIAKDVHKRLGSRKRSNNIKKAKNKANAQLSFKLQK